MCLVPTERELKDPDIVFWEKAAPGDLPLGKASSHSSFGDAVFVILPGFYLHKLLPWPGCGFYLHKLLAWLCSGFYLHKPRDDFDENGYFQTVTSLAP